MSFDGIAVGGGGVGGTTTTIGIGVGAGVAAMAGAAGAAGAAGPTGAGVGAAGAGVGAVGASVGSTDGVGDGSTDGVGAVLGCIVGSVDAPGVTGVALGRGSPCDGLAAAAFGLGAERVGTGETTAVFAVGPPAVDGEVDSPAMPKLSATVARMRFTTPSARTRRRR